MKDISVNIITNYNSYKFNDLRFYLKIIKDLKTTYHGHYAVTRSLIQGFKKIILNFLTIILRIILIFVGSYLTKHHLNMLLI